MRASVCYWGSMHWQDVKHRCETEHTNTNKATAASSQHRLAPDPVSTVLRFFTRPCCVYCLYEEFHYGCNPPKPIRIKSTVTHSALIAVFITLGCIFTGNTHSHYYILDCSITSAWTFHCRLLWCYCAFNVHSFFLKHSSITWRNSWSWLRWTCACGRCQIWFKKMMVSKTIHKVT